MRLGRGEEGVYLSQESAITVGVAALARVQTVLVEGLQDVHAEVVRIFGVGEEQTDERDHAVPVHAGAGVRSVDESGEESQGQGGAPDGALELAAGLLGGFPHGFCDLCGGLLGCFFGLGCCVRGVADLTEERLPVEDRGPLSSAESVKCRCSAACGSPGQSHCVGSHCGGVESSEGDCEG